MSCRRMEEKDVGRKARYQGSPDAHAPGQGETGRSQRTGGLRRNREMVKLRNAASVHRLM